MEITTALAQYNIIKKDDDNGKIYEHRPMLFQIKCETLEEFEKVRILIEELL